MMDIATSIYKLAQSISDRAVMKKTYIMDSFTTIPSTVQRSVTSDVSKTGMKVFYIDIKVRSMGTATYISLGRYGNIEERLTTVGEIYEAEAPRGAYLNTSDILMVSDTADAVLEVGGVLIPQGSAEE